MTVFNDLFNKAQQGTPVPNKNNDAKKEQTNKSIEQLRFNQNPTLRHNPL